MGESMDYDLIIIGAGPAGMTAGVFAVRKGLKTLLIGKEIGGQVNWTSDIENYMGFTEVNGQELMEKFQTQVKEHHLEEKLDEVRSISKDGDLFKLKTASGNEFNSKVVIVCSGKKPKTLNVKGEKEFRNRGVSYCSICDGPLFRDVAVAVIGGGNSAAKSVLDLANYASSIHLIYPDAKMTADQVLQQRLDKLDKLVHYPGHTVVEIMGNTAVEQIRVEEIAAKHQYDIPLQGVFIEIGLDPIVDFLTDAVELNEAKEIKVDCFCRTNVPGLYAAGDVSSVPEKQIIIAAGEGAKAAIKVWEYLMEMPESFVRH
jgi:alkyl hydroperoxide reductase subunit F